MARKGLRRNRSCFGGLVAASVILVATGFSQDFVMVTDSTNPIVSDPGSTGYIGASWVDYDNDGWLDLFVNRQSAVYKNLGNGNFTKVTAANIDQGNSYGNTWADFDNDGDPDCFVSGGAATSSGQRGSFLFRNDNGVFAKITAGDIGDSLFNSGWGSAWGDYDNDGFVDLVIAAPFGFAQINHPNRMFHNNGDGTFTRIDTSVITTGTAPYTVPAWSDYDQDGDLDLFIGSGPANGTLAPDYLYMNFLTETDTASFQRITTSPIATDDVDGQIWNWIDYDNDGDFDAYQTNYNFNTPNNLYRNNGGTFERRTAGQVGSIVSDPGSSLSNLWGDYDNDGDLDCIVTNDAAQMNRYYRNNSDGTFTRMDTLSIVTGTGPHYGAVAADYDNDGDLDVYFSGPTSAKGLYRNDLNNALHWISIKCIGVAGTTGSNISAIGARVRAKAVMGGNPVWQMREVSAQNSFNSMSMLDVHFGLSDAAIVDSLVITWPRGLVQTFTNVMADRLYRAVEGQPLVIVGVEERQAGIPTAFRLKQNYPNPFNPLTIIGFDVQRSDYITLKVFDLLGREVATLVNEFKAPGTYTVQFGASGLASGVYFYQLRVAGFSQTRKMLVMR